MSKIHSKNNLADKEIIKTLYVFKESKCEMSQRGHKIHCQMGMGRNYQKDRDGYNVVDYSTQC